MMHNTDSPVVETIHSDIGDHAVKPVKVENDTPRLSKLLYMALSCHVKIYFYNIFFIVFCNGLSALSECLRYFQCICPY